MRTATAHGSGPRWLLVRFGQRRTITTEAEPLHWESIRADGGDGITSVVKRSFLGGHSIARTRDMWTEYPYVRPGILDRAHDGNCDGQRLLRIAAAGNDGGKRTSCTCREQGFSWPCRNPRPLYSFIVGGYIGEGDERKPADTGQRGGSSICGDADPLCLFAPWQDPEGGVGTSASTPQVAAAMDTVWAVWPDMDVLDLRNLAFDCAEDMDAPEGETAVTRSYSYSNGRSFTSDTNSTWGHGILSMTCLFTPNGGRQNPVTGNAISGGIYGPVAGPITGASIAGVDYTGRDFGYGFARPVARENYALASLTQAATVNLSAVQPISGNYASTYVPGAFRGRLWERSSFRVDLTAAGNAIGAIAGWRLGDLTLQGGIAAQPEGVGSLTGSRAFRAPSTVSAAITAAYGKTLGYGFSAHIQADYWRTLATRGRSLWEARTFVSPASPQHWSSEQTHEFSLWGAWRSGLSGSLRVDGRYWDVSAQAKSGVWLTWRQLR